MKKQILVMTAALALTLTSCEKDEKKEVEPPKAKSRTEILTDREWDVKYIYSKTTMGDTVAFEDTDTINGTALFKANKELVSSTLETGLETGTWDLIGDSIYLDDQAMYIEELTDTRFVMSNTLLEMELDSISFSVFLQFTLTR